MQTITFIFRSLILALSISWRMVIFFILTIGLMALFVAATGIIGALVLALVAPAFSMGFQLVMLRAGLAAKGMLGHLLIGRLIWACFKYGSFITVMNWFLLLVSFAVIYVLDHYLNVTAWLVGSQIAKSLYQLPVDPAVFLMAAMLSTFLFSLFYIMMYVPMTARAYSCSARKPLMDFFWGFGGRLGAQITLNSLVFGSWFAIFAYLGTAFPESRLQQVDGLELSEILLIIGCLLVIFWTSFAPSAGAVTAFADMMSEEKDERTKDVTFERMSGDDLRALRKSR